MGTGLRRPDAQSKAVGAFRHEWGRLDAPPGIDEPQGVSGSAAQRIISLKADFTRRVEKMNKHNPVVRKPGGMPVEIEGDYPFAILASLEAQKRQRPIKLSPKAPGSGATNHLTHKASDAASMPMAGHIERLKLWMKLHQPLKFPPGRKCRTVLFAVRLASHYTPLKSSDSRARMPGETVPFASHQLY